MKIANSKVAFLLAIGDLLAYIFSLILTLAFRYGEIPSSNLLGAHISSFSILFVLFLIVSYSAGLYNKQTSFIRSKGQSLLFKVQLINIFIGIAFFYFAPVVIAPKANLFIFFVISSALLYIWRTVMFPVLSVTRSQSAVMVGSGDDIQDLHDEVNGNTRYGIIFRHKIHPHSGVEQTVSLIRNAVEQSQANIIVADLHDAAIESAMPYFYTLIFSGRQVVDASKLYESVFDRIPVSMVGERWLVENASAALGGRRVYDSLKRVMDVVIAGISGIVSLIFYPFVCLAIKIDDGGPVFIWQERVGRDGNHIRIAKFRSMSADDAGKYEHTGGKSKLKVTRVGKFIRMMRIDELPQLWSVLRGDQSLIGPRPELPALVSVYEKEIPYYNVRHLIKPGLSGWAQISHRAHPHHAVAVNDTRDKLSYDLYYIKNRSLGLDIRIALQTARALLSRQGV